MQGGGPTSQSGMESVLREEAWKSERTLNMYRSAFWLALGAILGLTYVLAGRRAPMLANLALMWGPATALFGIRTLSRRYHPAMSIALTTIDIAIAFIAQDDAVRAAAHRGHAAAHEAFGTLPVLMLIVASNLVRFSWPAIVWSVALAAAAYGALLVKNDLFDRAVFTDIFVLVGLGAILVYSAHRQRTIIWRMKEREALARFLPGPIVERLEANPLVLEMGGEQQDATVLFADIRDFTGLAEKLPPAEVVALLNEYFTQMVDEVFYWGGILDKFIGDGLCAVFVPRLAGKNEAYRAIQCGMFMLRRLVAINGRRASRGESPLRIGIGIHSGPVIAGSVGSRHRMEYTHIGDTVNCTSRIEQLTKELHEPLLVSAEAFERAGGTQAFPAREMPRTMVRGKRDPIRVWAVDVSHAVLNRIDATGDVERREEEVHGAVVTT